MKKINVKELNEILLITQRMNEIILDVPNTPIKYSRELFKGFPSTMLAFNLVKREAEEISSEAIYIKERKIDCSLNIIFKYIMAISHEMRHQYQTKIMYFNMDEYQDRRENNDTTSYNLQKEEIDAVAYANLFMDEYFGITPVYPEFNEFLLDEIRVRENLIEKQFFNSIDEHDSELNSLYQSLLIEIKKFQPSNDNDNSFNNVYWCRKDNRMEKIIALLIKKGAYEFIEINKNYNYDDVRKLLGTNEEISTTYRLIDKNQPLPLKFKVISKDYVPNPKFFTGVREKNGKVKGDIPEECLIILTDITFEHLIKNYSDVPVNILIQSLLESYIGYILLNKEDKNIQPAIFWDKWRPIFQ